MGGMISFDWSFLLADVIGSEHGVSNRDIDRWTGRALSVSKRISQERSDGRLAFWNILDDTSMIREVAEIKEEFKNRDIENVVILGIGGSALGARAIFHALRGEQHNLVSKPRLFVADNIDPTEFNSLMNLLNFEQTVFIVISKSGTTAETISQFLIVKNKIEKLFGKKGLRQHVVIITDPEKGLLRGFSRAVDVCSCSIPKDLGGRFSVLSPVGLVPSLFLGIDCEELIAGAREVANRCQSDDIFSNPAYLNGLYHVVFDVEKKKNIHVYWAYSSSLYSFSDWLRQLIAESLGKRNNGDFIGPTPVKALGVTDQHSQLQLYREGPNDKVITFLGVQKWASDLAIPDDKDIEEASYLSGHTLGELFHAEQQATACALAEAKRPNLTLWFPELSERCLGQAFFVYELQTVFMGYLYGINPFTQPGVELSKKMAYGLMGRKGFEKFADFVRKMRKSNKGSCV